MKTNKKLLALMLGVVLTCCQAVMVSAETTEAEKIISVEKQYLDDGYYCETVILEESSLFRSSSKTASKTSTFYNGNDEALWYVKVIGEFTYTGSSSKCTSASVSAASYVSTWKVSNKSSSYSGNTAKASATGKLYFGNAVVDTVNKTVSLTCSANGDLS